LLRIIIYIFVWYILGFVSYLNMWFSEALSTINKMQLSKGIIELDAKRIVIAVKTEEFLRTNWGIITQRCARILDQNNDVSISWVIREGNGVAHAFARLVVSEPNRYWASNFPICILNHIHKDMRHLLLSPYFISCAPYEINKIPFAT
jgi:hypothetical protein